MAGRNRGLLDGATRRVPYDDMVASHPNPDAVQTMNNWNNYAENSSPEAFGYASRHWGPAIQSLSDVAARRYEIRNGRPTGISANEQAAEQGARIRRVWENMRSEAEQSGINPDDDNAVLEYAARNDRTGNLRQTLELLRSQGLLR